MGIFRWLVLQMFGQIAHGRVYLEPRAGETVAFVPNRTSLAIMQLVHGYLTKTRKGWTLMDQQWIMEHLREWYGLDIARSTLCYNLKILRDQGIIETVTRHKRDPRTGEFVCQVTLYKMTKRLKKFFARLAGYFKRCGWVPTIKQLRMGFTAAVGMATTREEAFQEYRKRKRDYDRGTGT